MSITADQSWQLPPPPQPVRAAADAMWRNLFGAVKRSDGQLISNAARYLSTGDLLGQGVVSLAGHSPDDCYPQIATAAAAAAMWHRGGTIPHGGRRGVDLGRALRIAGYRTNQLEQTTRLMRSLLTSVDDPTGIRSPLLRTTAILRSARVAPSWTLLAEHLAAAGAQHTDQVRLLWSRSFHTAPTTSRDAADTTSTDSDPAPPNDEVVPSLPDDSSAPRIRATLIVSQES